MIFRKKQYRIILSLVFVLIFSFIMKRPVLAMLNVSQPDTVESLSIPMQQIARVVVDENDLSSQQTELLSKVIDIEKIPDSYSPILHDPIKLLVREKGTVKYLKEHIAEYTKLYLELGLKHPIKFVEAWVDQTKGYWNGGYEYWRWADGVDKKLVDRQILVLGIVCSTSILNYMKN